MDVDQVDPTVNPTPARDKSAALRAKGLSNEVHAIRASTASPQQPLAAGAALGVRCSYEVFLQPAIYPVVPLLASRSGIGGVASHGA